METSTKIGLTGVGALIAGTLIGGIGFSTHPEPEVITKTKTVETEVTPQSCIKALNRAEDAFDAYSQGFGILANTLGDVAAFDAAGIDENTEKLDMLKTNKLDPALTNYFLDAKTCRSK